MIKTNYTEEFSDLTIKDDAKSLLDEPPHRFVMKSEHITDLPDLDLGDPWAEAQAEWPKKEPEIEEEPVEDEFQPEVEEEPLAQIIPLRAEPRPDPQTDPLLTFGDNDDGNALSVLHLYGDHILHTSALGWMVWTGTHWSSQDAYEKVYNLVVDTFYRRREAAAAARDRRTDAIYTAATPMAWRVNACMKALFPKVKADFGEFDSNPDLVNAWNGVIDLRIGKLKPHSPDQRFTYVRPTPYDPKADYSHWRDLLIDWTGSEEIADYLQLAIGYSMTGYTSHEAFWYIYGPPRSGKGTFTETLLHLLGKPLSTGADMGILTQSREMDPQNFALAPLKPTRFIVVGESGRYEKFNEAKLKMLTGGDEIRAAFKGKNSFSYRPQFKFWVCSNNEPRGDADDDAFWSRARIIEFPNSHLGREDEGLKQRLLEPDFQKGILAWAVEGAKRWYTKGFTTPIAVKEITKKIQASQDFVGQWIEEECTLDETAWTSTSRLHQSYEDWCDENGITSLKSPNFGRALAKKGFKRLQKMEKGTRSWGMEGIRL